MIHLQSDHAAPSLALAARNSAVAPVFSQDSYPSKAIRLIVLDPPVGFTDILGRLVSRKVASRPRAINGSHQER
jgi:tripartite-type tricarboxylate transporter receptor subunit TctC